MTTYTSAHIGQRVPMSWGSAAKGILALGAVALVVVLPHSNEPDPIGSVETPAEAQLNQLLAPRHEDFHELRTEGTGLSFKAKGEVAGAAVDVTCTNNFRLHDGIVSVKFSDERCTEAVPGAR
jgi:hypothetical protein